MLQALTLLTALSLTTLALPSEKLETVHRRRDEPSESLIPPTALRDRSKLKYEISGIVGAYVFWLIITILLLVFISKRLKKTRQTSGPTPTTTMMKTFRITEQVVEVPVMMDGQNMKSPSKLKSPSFASIRSWGKKGHKPSASVYSNATVDSVVSHEAQKARDMDDLTKLYAAVMAHDEERSQGQNSAINSPQFPISPASPPVPMTPMSPQPPMSPQHPMSPISPGYPPEFAHLHSLNNLPQSPKLPKSPRSPRSPPPNQPCHDISAPTPRSESFPNGGDSYYDPNIPSRASSRNTRTSPMSFISERAGSFGGKSRPSALSIRGQNISSPIGSADLRDAHFYEETVPLSPRVYTPGPPPPTPGRKKQVHVVAEPVVIHHADHDSEYDPKAQQLQQFQQYQQEQAQIAQHMRDSLVPSSLNATASGPANGSKALPFRDMFGDKSLRSAPPTKTTFLERPTKLISGPKTGVPYSPYTPFTPMTPITPRRLMNKRDLKAKRKEERLKVLSEDDLVEANEDMWGS